MFMVNGWALIAVTVGMLIPTYVISTNSRKKVSEAEKHLLSMQDFVGELTRNDILLQEELVANNTELNRRMFQLATLLEIAKELMVARSPGRILDRIPVIVRSLVPSRGVAIRILSPDETCLNLVSHIGLPAQYIESTRSVPVESSPFAQVIKENKPLSGVVDYGPVGSHLEVVGSEGVTFVLSVPIVMQGKVAGVLSAYTPNLYDRTADDIQLLTILAAYASTALESAKLYEELGLAYQELSRLKDYNESILESVTIGLAVVDRDLTVTTWNTGMENITGMLREAAVGHKFFEILHFDEESGVIDVLREVLEDGIIHEVNRFEYVDPDGCKCVVSCRVCPLMSLDEADGGEKDSSDASDLMQPLGAIIVVEDITATVNLEEQLRWAERMKVVGEFSAGIAHEINNPIGIISACAEHLAKKLEKEEFLHDYLRTLKVIEDEAGRCSAIIRNLTVFSRRQEFNLKATDMKHVVQGVLEVIRPQAEQSGVAIKLNEIQGARDGFLVLADEAQIRQVFLNLVLNAIQAMPDGGLLTVDISRDSQNGADENVKICFTDTGCGIREEDLKKVFTPFFTTHSSGIGLGLAVSHGIIQSHGGSLTVHSKEGQGSSFAVSLPCYSTTIHATP